MEPTLATKKSMGYKHRIQSLAMKSRLFAPESLHPKQKVGGRNKETSVEPWGGNGGTAWDDGRYSGVRRITVVYGRCIDSIQVEYDNKGRPLLAQKHGGNGGNHTITFVLDYPDEYITEISGHYSKVVHGGTPVIRSLTIRTNTKTFGPFGIEEGTPFCSRVEGSHIVGFKGRSGWYIDSLGFHLSPLPPPPNLYNAMHKKLQKIGTFASKSFGYTNTNQPTNTKSKKGFLY